MTLKVNLRKFIVAMVIVTSALLVAAYATVRVIAYYSVKTELARFRIRSHFEILPTKIYQSGERVMVANRFLNIPTGGVFEIRWNDETFKPLSTESSESDHFFSIVKNPWLMGSDFQKWFFYTAKQWTSYDVLSVLIKNPDPLKDVGHERVLQLCLLRLIRGGYKRPVSVGYFRNAYGVEGILHESSYNQTLVHLRYGDQYCDIIFPPTASDADIDACLSSLRWRSG